MHCARRASPNFLISPAKDLRQGDGVTMINVESRGFQIQTRGPRTSLRSCVSVHDRATMTLTSEITHEPATAQRWRSRRARLWLIGLLALVFVAAVAVLPPLPEPQVFRSFADDRMFFGISNYLNVVSNAPFLLVGVWALHFLARDSRHPGAFADPMEKWPYVCCFFAVALVSAGSAYFHLAPDSARLVWDRLPMSLGFMALLSAVVVERIGMTAGLRLLVPLLLMGAGSVIYWRWSQLHGTEDVLPYAAVQYGSIAAIVVIALLFPSRFTRGTDIFGVVAIYAAAKAAEVLDAQIYALGQIVSGHTLKHLIAALAAWWLLRMLQLRRVQ